MAKNKETDELLDEMEKTSADNKKFLADIDGQIKRADLKYVQMIIEEEKGLLEAAKKSLENSDK